MKATGIVRRIDDLGRLVVPREIRHAMGIEEGAPFEVFTDEDGSVIFTPYRPTQEDAIAAELEALANFYDHGSEYARARDIRKIKADLLKSVRN
jgi:stage V sporulation protein T